MMIRITWNKKKGDYTVTARRKEGGVTTIRGIASKSQAIAIRSDLRHGLPLRLDNELA